MKIKILATGGTFDKIYYDAKSDFHIGEPMANPILEEANVTFEFEVESILKKDSLEMNDEDRETIRQKVETDACDRIVITHGSDSMIKTAMCLLDIKDKTIVITGAMQPARMRYTDSAYNMGVATMAVQLLEAGVYITMNGQIFDPRSTRKNVAQSRFEPEA
ncbi:MAG: asparaginase domain-containing protein [Gammaproteobacteria bacterium]|nr:asparaginase domain-containing protein [Gammaproteobacteria bacterium]